MEVSDHDPGETARTTYCGNVHPATDLDSWFESIQRFTVPIAAARKADGKSFGLGTWWNAATLEVLNSDSEKLGQLQQFLAERELPLWTVNAFPYGAFHDTAVKTSVYEPSWETEERVLFTRHAAEVVGRVVSPGGVVPMSTLPLCYGEGDSRLMARNLVRAVSHLNSMAEYHGVQIVLALEPEPYCRLETVAQTIEFLEEWVFRGDGWAVPESVLRRHLGVCVDLCHLAVVREDAVAAVESLAAHEIQCAKVQVSACPELRDPAAELDQLLAFEEPVYLHQTVADTGARALDLPEVAARRAEFEAAGLIRTHFHTPIFWDSAGALGSTRAELERVIRGLPRPLPLLEVETYSWEVLPGWIRGDAHLREGIGKELLFLDDLL